MERTEFNAHQEYADAVRATDLQRAQATIEDLREQLVWEREERENITHTQLVIGIIIGFIAACLAGNLAGVWS